MNIVLTSTSGVALYRQIIEQIEASICTNCLHAGDALPSIRVLAKNLHINMLTVKHAYEELEEKRYIITTPCCGSTVTESAQALAREAYLKRAKGHLATAVYLASLYGLTHVELYDPCPQSPKMESMIL